MNKLNQWLTLLANLGVVAGIIFLVIEIRQNTEALHAESHQALFAGGQQELYTLMSYPDLQEIMAAEDIEPTLHQKFQMDAWLAAALGARQYAWRQYIAGNIDEDTWQSEIQIISILVGSRLTRSWWLELGHLQFQGEFSELVTNIAKDEPLNPYWKRLREWKLETSSNGT